MFLNCDHSMRPHTVVIAHREAMVAEGLAWTLGRYPAIVPLAPATTAGEAETQGRRAHAVALDEMIPGAASAAKNLRRNGVRVVMIGDGEDEDGTVRVSTKAPLAELASALVPGISPQPPTLKRLTPRQRDVLALVAKGMAGKQVAHHLGISPKTVEIHKTKIYEKLGVSNQTAAVSYAMSGERDKQRDNGV